MLVAPAVDPVAVGVHSKDQDHGAPHDAPSYGAHRRALNHVQGDHLVTFIEIKSFPRLGGRAG